MQIHQLKPEKGIRKTKKRIGRGGKRGTYSGKGQKGQKSRAGAKIRPAKRDELISIPKLRGSKNKTKTKREIIALNLVKINKIENKKITKSILIKLGFINKNQDVKILGVGSIKSSKEFVEIKISKSAKEKILKAGGKIIDKIKK